MIKKKFDANDPMELVGVSLPGADLDQMAECLVEEYIRGGWDDESLLRLFRDPFYQATHRVYQEKGEMYVHRLIATLRQRWGYYKGEDISCWLGQDEFKKPSSEEAKSDGKLA